MVSGAAGEFGQVDEYVLPRWRDQRRTRCPRGHRFEIGGVSGSYSHALYLSTTTCLACQTAGADRASWAEVDVTAQYEPETAPGVGLALVRHRPDAPAGPGRIELMLGRVTVGYVELLLCPIERRAVLRSLEVERPEHRRTGYGTVLAAAARALAPDYDWSLPRFDEDDVARAFWAAVGVPGPSPVQMCSHMRKRLGLPLEAWTGV